MAKNALIKSVFTVGIPRRGRNVGLGIIPFWIANQLDGLDYNQNFRHFHFLYFIQDPPPPACVMQWHYFLNQNFLTHYAGSNYRGKEHQIPDFSKDLKTWDIYHPNDSTTTLLPIENLSCLGMMILHRARIRQTTTRVVPKLALILSWQTCNAIYRYAVKARVFCSSFSF